jgi:hypothetical protein
MVCPGAPARHTILCHSTLLSKLTRKLAEATKGLVAILEDELKVPVDKDKTFKLASDAAVLKLLDDALPGFQGDAKFKQAAGSLLETDSGGQAYERHFQIPET